MFVVILWLYIFIILQPLLTVELILMGFFCCVFFLSSQMLGITETVFAPKPPEPETNNKTRSTPMNILRLEADHGHKYINTSVGEIARNAGPPKMKRPMETNRLETGPPQMKSARMGILQRDVTMPAENIVTPHKPVIGSGMMGVQQLVSSTAPSGEKKNLLA